MFKVIQTQPKHPFHEGTVVAPKGHPKVFAEVSLPSGLRPASLSSPGFWGALFPALMVCPQQSGCFWHQAPRLPLPTPSCVGGSKEDGGASARLQEASQRGQGPGIHRAPPACLQATRPCLLVHLYAPASVLRLPISYSQNTDLSMVLCPPMLASRRCSEISKVMPNIIYPQLC